MIPPLAALSRVARHHRPGLVKHKHRETINKGNVVRMPASRDALRPPSHIFRRHYLRFLYISRADVRARARASSRACLRSGWHFKRRDRLKFMPSFRSFRNLPRRYCGLLIFSWNGRSCNSHHACSYIPLYRFYCFYLNILFCISTEVSRIIYTFRRSLDSTLYFILLFFFLSIELECHS